MPQMKPMNWLVYFIIFSLLIININILNYFTTINYSINNINSNKNLKMNMKWKW